MSNDKMFVRRGTYYGPMYDVDHLATFTVGSKLGKWRLFVMVSNAATFIINNIYLFI